MGRLARAAAAMVALVLSFCAVYLLMRRGVRWGALPESCFATARTARSRHRPFGEFDMGSNAKTTEQPVHHVSIRKNFAVSRHYFCRVGPMRGPVPVSSLVRRIRVGAGRRPGDECQLGTTPSSLPRGSQVRLGRLIGGPRGGVGTPAEEGRQVLTGGERTWRRDTANCRQSAGQPGDRARFRPNAFGLYDTAGNAAEWVQDCREPDARRRAQGLDLGLDGAGDCSLRVLRGGSFDKAVAVRSSARFRYDDACLTTQMVRVARGDWIDARRARVEI